LIINISIKAKGQRLLIESGIPRTSRFYVNTQNLTNESVESNAAFETGRNLAESVRAYSSWADFIKINKKAIFS
jgi:hypothetical protein